MTGRKHKHTVPDATMAKSAGTLASSVKVGTAVEYWQELEAYPEATARSAWLKVDGSWVRLDDPSDPVERALFAAFTYPDKFEARVWYSDGMIVGLVVNSKKSA